MFNVHDPRDPRGFGLSAYQEYKSASVAVLPLESVVTAYEDWGDGLTTDRLRVLLRRHGHPLCDPDGTNYCDWSCAGKCDKVYDAGRHLGDMFGTLFSQKLDESVEVLHIDLVWSDNALQCIYRRPTKDASPDHWSEISGFDSGPSSEPGPWTEVLANAALVDDERVNLLSYTHIPVDKYCVGLIVPLVKATVTYAPRCVAPSSLDDSGDPGEVSVPPGSILCFYGGTVSVTPFAGARDASPPPHVVAIRYLANATSRPVHMALVPGTQVIAAPPAIEVAGKSDAGQEPAPVFSEYEQMKSRGLHNYMILRKKIHKVRRFIPDPCMGKKVGRTAPPHRGAVKTALLAVVRDRNDDECVYL